MMFSNGKLPNFVGYATTLGDNSYGTSINAVLPSGLAAGDLMLMGVGCELHTPNTPTGWTLLTTGTHLYTFSKTASVGETAPTVTFASNPGDRIVTIRAYRGTASTPSVAVSASNDVTSGACTAGQPSYTGTATCVYFWSDFTPFVGLPIVLPAGLSNGTTIQGAFESEASGDEQLALTGTTPARTATGGTSNSEWTGATIVTV